MIILCVLFRKYSFVPKRPLVLFVCLSPAGYNFKPISTKLHHMVEFVISKKPIAFEVKTSKRQHRPKVNNWGEISKILNFHPIDLKFEEYLYIWSLNLVKYIFGILQVSCSARHLSYWSVCYLWKQVFASVLVCLFVQTFVCLFVTPLEPTVLIGTIWIFFRW